MPAMRSDLATSGLNHKKLFDYDDRPAWGGFFVR